MLARMRQRGIVSNFAALIAALTIGAFNPSHAQAQDQPYLAAVTASDVFVRSGPDFAYYAVGQLDKADVVKVISERSGFARVAMVGPAFKEFFGYVILNKSQTGRFRLEPDGRTGVVLGRMDVIGPNAQSNADPTQSWKPLMYLQAEDRVTILKTTETDRDIIYNVALPDAASGWISMNHLRRATPEEEAAWTRLMPQAPEEKTNAAAAASESPATILAREENHVPPVTTEPAKSSATTAAQPAATPAAPPATTEPAPAQSEQPIVNPVEPIVLESTITEPATEAPPAPISTTVPSPKPAERVRQITLEDLQAKYDKLKRQPTETAEIEPLRQQYLAFADRPGVKQSEARYARARADQLQVWADAQKRIQDLAELRERAKENRQFVRQKIDAVHGRMEYTAIGRLEASTIYDGAKLPRLLRIQDVATGRTLAYIDPDAPTRQIEEGEVEPVPVITMIGNIVGVVGDKGYDGGLRLNVITPVRVDVLTNQGRAEPATETGAETSGQPTTDPDPIIGALPQ